MNARGPARITRDRGPGETFFAGSVQRGGPGTPVVDVRDGRGTRDRSAGRGDAAGTTSPPAAVGSADIADLLELLATANSAVTAELESITGDRRSPNRATVNRPEHLVERMRPAARVRQLLAALDPVVSAAGAREWHRRRPVGPGRRR